MAERGVHWEPRDHKMAEEEEDEDKEPEMDGTCDACEPDEPQPATLVCPACRFAFCTLHGDAHTRSTRHQTLPYHPEPSNAEGARPQGGADRLQGVGVPVGLDRGQGAQNGGVGGREGYMNGHAEEAADEGAVGGEPAQEGGQEGSGKKETVSVERLRCREHNQEGSLYCKLDEKIICVICAVQGEHREHEIITLREAYHWQKSREGIDLVSRTQEMAEKIQSKWTSPDMNKDELEVYVNQQFDELHQLVRLEEKRTLHLVDLKEAFLTAQANEMIAEISVNTERLQEEVDCITQQLGELEQAAVPPPEAGHDAQHPDAGATAAPGANRVDDPGPGPDAGAPAAGPAGPAGPAAAGAAEAIMAALAAPVPGPLPAAIRLALGADARPRMPDHRDEPRDRRGYGDGDSDAFRGGYAP